MRARALAVAGALAISMTLGAAPALADQPTATSDHAAAPVKKERKVHATGRDSGGNLRVVAKVKGDPTYAHKTTTLQKKECPGCHWVNVRSQRTNGVAKVIYRVNVPRNDSRFFRVMVPATSRYKKGISNVLRACSGSAC